MYIKTILHRLLPVVLCAITANGLFAQSNIGGTPLSLQAKTGLTKLDALPTYRSPALNMAAIEAENALIDPTGIRHIGKLVPAHQTLENSGEWATFPNGDRLWRLKIVATNALAVTLYYDNFRLPKGAKMFVFATDGKETYGAFTDANNNDNNLFVTAMTHTDECVIEYFEPANVRGQGVIDIGQVAHAYRDVKSRNANAPTTNAGMGPCNVDVNCPEGATWVDQKQAVVTLLTTANANQSFCTGAMINNTRQDCKPYVLTANHCISGNTAADYAQMAFYFNHEAAVCGGTVESPNQIVAGAVFRAASGGNGVQLSDFALLEITSPIPAAANHYFAGWDANDVPATSGVSIHHPAGVIKKISTYTAPLVSTDYSNAAPGTTHWHVFWVQTQTNYGITEGGSSGSPLFNQDHRIVGDLSGGPSSCTATDKSDYYGKFSNNWANGTTPATRLKDWLDPDNTGIMAMDGTYSPCSGFLLATTAAAPSICAGSTDSIAFNITINGTGAPVTLTASGVPANVTASFSPATVATTNASNLVFAVANNATPGTYTVTVTGTNGSVTQTKTVTLTITNGVPTATNLQTPANAAIGVGYNPTLSWAAIAGATSYTVEVATDNAFTNIIETTTGTITNNHQVGITLTGSTQYFWRVKANNGCGAGVFSAPFSFTTGVVQCFSLVNANTTTITDAATTTSVINVGASASLASISVKNLRGTHTYTADLTFTLISPQGTRVTLLGGLCGANNDFDLSLDDAAAAGAIPCPLTGAGTYQPQTPFSALNGEDIQGNWTLEIVDVEAPDAGALQNWSLDICAVSQGAICALSANVTPATLCNAGTVTAAAANTTGGTASFVWSTGETTASIALATPGVYTVTVTEGACSATNTVILNSPATPTITGNLTNCGPSTITLTGGTAYTWSGGTATGTLGQRRFAASGTYTVTMTAANGCTGTTTLQMVINTIPAATVTGATTACGMATLVGGAVTGATYTWSGGDLPTAAINTFSTSGLYTLTVTSAAGCTRTVTRTLTINPLPVGTAIATDQTTDTPANGALQVSATGSAAPYTFSITGSTNTTGAFAGLASGSYTVTITDATPCTSTVTANIAYMVGTEKLPTNVNSLRLSPNPTRGQFNVALDLAIAQTTNLEIIDLMGRVLHSQTINASNTPNFAVDMTEFAADMYFVRLRIGAETTMLKVSVVR
jgi:subtilisin-like proprotein convertase family protein